MSREMMKAGIISEMLEDVLQDDALEDEADEEVERVMHELTDGLLDQAGSVGSELINEKEQLKQKQKEQLEFLSS
jgi:charged multivesicular body protein 3